MTNTFGVCNKCGYHHHSEAFCMPKTIVDAAEPGLLAEIAKPLSIHSEHPPMPPCDHDECGPLKCESTAKECEAGK